MSFLTLRKDKYIFWKDIVFGRFYFTKKVYSYYQTRQRADYQYAGHSSKPNTKARCKHHKANILRGRRDSHTARWLSLNLERNSRKYVMNLYRRMFGATGYVSTLYKTYGCSRKAQVLHSIRTPLVWEKEQIILALFWGNYRMHLFFNTKLCLISPPL